MKQFIVDTLIRLTSKSPKYFKALQILIAVVIALSGFLTFAQAQNLFELPPFLAIFTGTDSIVMGFITLLLASLPVSDTSNLTNMNEHWEFSLQSMNDTVVSVGQQQYGVQASQMQAATNGAYYTVQGQQNKLYTQSQSVNVQTQMQVVSAANGATYFVVPVKRPK